MNWITLKSLREIYNTSKTKTKVTLLRDSGIQHLLGTKELFEVGKFIVAGNGFRKYYESNHLANFNLYFDFLERTELLEPQARFEESDLRILIDLEERMQTGELIEIRNQIIDAEETVRGVSSMFFRNEKHLESSKSLTKAIKKILDIPILANDKDQQYMYVLKCTDPKAIVLCENLDFLKRPSRPRRHNIELWYAGGKNVEKLEFADTRGLSIYYSCDWDYDGLLIYQMVKKKLPEIQLLFPNAESKSITETDHDSHWKSRNNLEAISGLDQNEYSDSYKQRIKQLIAEDDWIIEEDNDLIQMIANH